MKNKYFTYCGISLFVLFFSPFIFLPQRERGLCKKVVAAFSFSWKKKRDLATAQEELKLPRHKMVTESPTRWGSRQKMVASVIEQHKAISQVLTAVKKKRNLVPTWQDIDVLESINDALKPLLEFTDSLSGEYYVSVSYLKPVLHLFKTEALKHSDDNTLLIKDIKTMVIEYLSEKYDDEITDKLLDTASLVDPGFKTRYIRPDEIEAIKTRAVSEILNTEGDQGPSTSQASYRTEEIEAEGELLQLFLPRNRGSHLAVFLRGHPPATQDSLTCR